MSIIPRILSANSTINIKKTVYKESGDIIGSLLTRAIDGLWRALICFFLIFYSNTLKVLDLTKGIT